MRGFAAIWLSLAVACAAAPAWAQAYPPDGPDIPVVKNSEDASGAFGLGIKTPPPPKGWDRDSIWNMKIVGYTDNQGRPIYQPLVVH
ncbi:MAG TPA: hypothetical protein VGG57_10575 [Stellaceae bacterium]|jgi:hypothetical protein